MYAERNQTAAAEIAWQPPSLWIEGSGVMLKKTQPESAANADQRLPQRKSLDLEKIDLSALTKAADILLRELDHFIELPSYLNWSPVAFAALTLEREMMTLTPDLAEAEHADALLPLYGPCSREKAVPFRELWVLLRQARPDPRGCGEHAGGVWIPGPDNLEDASKIVQRLRPIVQRLLALAPKPAFPQIIPSSGTQKLLDVAQKADREPPRLDGESGNADVAAASLFNQEQPLPPAARKAALGQLEQACRKAYYAYQYAESKAGKCLADDKAHDFLKENGIDENGSHLDEPALTDYEVPSRDTWKRYLREARKALGEQKNRRRGRPTITRSIVKGDQIEHQKDNE
jgi:hypothetical protein